VITDGIDKMLNYIILFLICFLPTTLLANSHASKSAGKPQTQPKHEFAFVIDCDWAGKESNICLLGNYKRGIGVTLLEVGQPRTCLSQTRDAVDHKDEAGDTLYPFTPIFPVAQCKGAQHYSIAVLGSRISSYQIVKLDEVTDKRKVQSLDKFTRSKKVLEKLRTKAQGESGEIYELSKDMPKVHRYPIPRMETFIVSYNTLLGELDIVSGPRAIVINGIVYPLTGWCSHRYMRAFSLDGEYYLESGSHCCECGISIQELFKIKKTGPVEVHSDGSLSD
jgi:hypothetical protein